jgi:L-cysteine desulfidase
MYREELLQTLRRQVKPAVGCTEPIAVALATANARKFVRGKPERILVVVSPNIYKNGFSVTIPGTDKTGNAYAAALAFAGGNPDLGLEVLKNCSKEDYERAEELLPLVEVRFDRDKTGVYVSATVETATDAVEAVITNKHDEVVRITHNDEIVFAAARCTESGASGVSGDDFDVTCLSLAELRREIGEIPPEELRFLLEGVTMNMAMAEEGLRLGAGLGIGRSFRELLREGVIEDSLLCKVRMVAAAATDARMGGVPLPVMSSAGSGNHGITAIVPLKVLADARELGEEVLVRGLAFSHLVTLYIKSFTGRLSPVCGCAVAAGTGAAAGMTWMLGGDDDAIAAAINMMLGNLAGLLCDGAKHDCALKIATSAGEALLAALLAVKGVAMSGKNGIVVSSAEESIRHLGRISTTGMKDTDEVILQIITGA